MERLRTEESNEQLAIAQIEMCFKTLDTIWNSSDAAPTVYPDSIFAKDRVELREYPIDQWAWPLMVVAYDHMHLLRRVGGQMPDGLEEWHTHAPWTLLRAALEASSMVIWLISPKDRHERLERLLRMVHDDLVESQKATRLVYPLRKRSNLPLFKKSDEEFAVTAKPWTDDDASRRRIYEDINLVDCIKDASRKSGVAKEDVADLLWRTASGHAHGSRWAQLTVGVYQFENNIDESTMAVRGMIDLTNASKLIMLVTGMIQYAGWLFATRAGNDTPSPDLISVKLTRGD